MQLARAVKTLVRPALLTGAGPVWEEDTVRYVFGDAEIDPSKFWKFLSPTCAQAEVFSNFEDFPQLIINGFNCSILSLGPSLSGKSHTLFGPDVRNKDEMGLVPRLLETLFAQIEELQDPRQYFVTMSAVEILDGGRRDILASAEAGASAADFEAFELGVGEPPCDRPVSSGFAAISLLDYVLRSFNACSAAPARASLVLKVAVRGVAPGFAETTFGSLHVIDLAGTAAGELRLARVAVNSVCDAALCSDRGDVPLPAAFAPVYVGAGSSLVRLEEVPMPECNGLERGLSVPAVRDAALAVAWLERFAAAHGSHKINPQFVRGALAVSSLLGAEVSSAVGPTVATALIICVDFADDAGAEDVTEVVRTFEGFCDVSSAPVSAKLLDLRDICTDFCSEAASVAMSVGETFIEHWGEGPDEELDTDPDDARAVPCAPCAGLHEACALVDAAIKLKLRETEDVKERFDREALKYVNGVKDLRRRAMALREQHTDMQSMRLLLELERTRLQTQLGSDGEDLDELLAGAYDSQVEVAENKATLQDRRKWLAQIHKIPADDFCASTHLLESCSAAFCQPELPRERQGTVLNSMQARVSHLRSKLSLLEQEAIRKLAALRSDRKKSREATERVQRALIDEQVEIHNGIAATANKKAELAQARAKLGAFQERIEDLEFKASMHKAPRFEDVVEERDAVVFRDELSVLRDRLKISDFECAALNDQLREIHAENHRLKKGVAKETEQYLLHKTEQIMSLRERIASLKAEEKTLAELHSTELSGADEVIAATQREAGVENEIVEWLQRTIAGLRGKSVELRRFAQEFEVSTAQMRINQQAEAEAARADEVIATNDKITNLKVKIAQLKAAKEAEAQEIEELRNLLRIAFSERSKIEAFIASALRDAQKGRELAEVVRKRSKLLAVQHARALDSKRSQLRELLGQGAPPASPP